MSIAFRRGKEGDLSGSARGLARVLSLPSQQKHELAQFLMEHFGARNLTRKGDEYTHSCLLPYGHVDSNPSASFNAEKLTYRCWACGAGGLLWFVQAMTDMDAEEAVRFLLGEVNTAGLSSLNDLLAFIESTLSPESAYAEPIPRYDVRILDRWMVPEVPYLTEERGIPNDNLIHMGVGFDHGRERVIIPHFWEGDLVGWQSRRTAKDGSPKYLSTPGFPKDETLYNLHPDQAAIVVVESPMTVVAKAHLPYPFVATFGAKVTDQQVRRIARHERVVLWMDNDPAGWNSTERLLEELPRLTNVQVVDSLWEQDAGDLPDDEVERLLGTTVPSALWTRPRDGLHDFGKGRA